MNKIIGFFGKKQSGKGSCSTFVAGLNLMSYRAIDSFNVLDNHCLLVDNEQVLVNDIAPNVVKIYSFADKLKWLSVEIFQVDPKSVFGTDEEKGYHTHLRWEDMPGVITNKRLYTALKKTFNKQVELYNLKDNFPVLYREPGFLTGRQLLQYFGSDICRNVYDSCWVDYLINTIKKDKPIFSIIADGRFDNEVTKLKENNAFLIHLLRDVYSGKDTHKSENAISSEEHFDLIIDNRKMSVKETFKDLIVKIKDSNILAPIV